MIPVDMLHFLFDVTEQGMLIRKISVTSGAREGDVISAINSSGYIIVGIFGKSYSAHRVIFAMSRGMWPKGPLDHINGIRSDNRPSNLRELSTADNNRNMKCHREGKLFGVSKRPGKNRYQARVRIYGNMLHLGDYDTEEEAHNIVKQALFAAEAMS